MYRPVVFQGATRPVSVTTTGPPVENAGAVVGEFVLHENVICPVLPSVTFTGVGGVGSQFFVIDPAIGTAGCVCCIRIDAATSPTATKTISESKLRTSFLHHRGSSSRHIRWVSRKSGCRIRKPSNLVKEPPVGLPVTERTAIIASCLLAVVCASVQLRGKAAIAVR